MTQHFTAPDGTRLAYDVQGVGKPLLCLSGLTRNRADFDHVLPHLTGVQVIRMDYRGRGDSDRADPATYTILHEAQDAIALLDHLGLARVAVLGTSRGGLIALVLGHMAKARLTGVAFNDIGPVIERPGLERIAAYVGRTPVAGTLQDHANRLEMASPGFANVPPGRWLDDATRQVRVTPKGLALSYDPALRDSFMAGLAGPPVDLWPLYDALSGLPLAAIRGANSDLMSAATLAQMQRRRPDLIAATVPDRAHVPWLDEPESVAALHAFLKALP
jgi:pimeloyl-ACP methyl ester carboxylesterase